VSLRAGREKRPTRFCPRERFHAFLSSFIGRFQSPTATARSLAVDPNTLEYAHLIALEQTRPFEGPSAFTMVGVYLNRNQAARKIAKIIYTRE
jgi:hypothetical protein